MKKLFTSMALALASLGAMATDYTDQLEVAINGESVTLTSKITVDKQENGKYTLQLHDFMLQSGSDVIPVGNIDLNDVEGTTDANGVTTLRYNNTILLSNGDNPEIVQWMGPLLGPVPVDMIAEIRGEKLYTVININMASLGQVIKVTFGNGGYQIGNAGFENFHTASVTNPYSSSDVVTSDEPDNWHSFMSATNDGLAAVLAWMATNTPHTFISDVTRPGSKGTHSVLITSTSILGIVANGTITTGRLNAGSATAADKANHSWCDLSSTDTDANGDPFYTELSGLPDSVSVWVKFKQKSPSSEYPYATISAAITDGTYYQDPEDKEYTNVIARAKNNTIESLDGAWQKVTVPFNYEIDSNEAFDSSLMDGRKVLLVTISTNAEPGKGSIDSLNVDDIELIYGCKLNDIKLKGESIVALEDGVFNYEASVNSDTEITSDDITVTSSSKGARITKSVTTVENSNDVKVVVTVTTADLKESNTYTFVLSNTSGISSVAKTTDKQLKAVYNMAGQRIGKSKAGQMVISKYADGTTVKSIKK